ncbi:MAG: carboxy terminal-processing peptidase [Bacteroidia bacterium]|nr:carboxy terminal-processing peptidase [Bacteroidia bacterium]
MKAKIFLYSLAVSALILFSSYTFVGGDKGQILVKSMMRIMMYYHYQPQEIDDNFSEKVFDKYIERLDYSKRFFLQSEIDNLSLYRSKIDDELQNESFEFFELTSGILTHRIDMAEEYCMEILSKPFDFSLNEEYDTDVENKPYATNEKEIKDRWRKEIKYKVLGRLVSAAERQDKNIATAKEKGEEFDKKSFEELEKEAREKVQKEYKRYFDRVQKIKESDRQADYINAITSTFDPHTNYYPPREKERFNQNITGRFEGIGASLNVDDEGLIRVVQIIPGSASSRQGDLQANDRILKVGQNVEEAVDVVGMDLQDAIKLIKGPKGTEVRLTVRKPDGSEKIIPITRDVVVLEETYAKSSVILDKEEGSKIGFIHLPGFYADFTRSGGRNSAEDVAKELEKLNKEEVEGIILDLRNNGGGSLAEVIEMVGLFVEKGPVVQVKSREGDIRVMKDRNPAITYDGKLIVLVNSSSASASEILAAAVQDYDRGLIVGSKSTFGKGTVQRFLNLDDFIRGGDDIKPLGEIKLTTQKYYRINGGATQLKGVTPDVILPDVYNLIDTGEKDQDQAMPWDEIVPASYSVWEQPVSKQLEGILEKSQERVNSNNTFTMIEENAKRYKKRYDRTMYPLNIDAFKAYKAEVEAEAKKYENIAQPIDGMDVKFVGTDYDFIHSDSSRLDRYEVWHKGIKKDAMC